MKNKQESIESCLSRQAYYFLSTYLDRKDKELTIENICSIEEDVLFSSYISMQTLIEIQKFQIINSK